MATVQECATGDAYMALAPVCLVNGSGFPTIPMTASTTWPPVCLVNRSRLYPFPSCARVRADNRKDFTGHTDFRTHPEHK